MLEIEHRQKGNHFYLFVPTQDGIGYLGEESQVPKWTEV